MDLKLKFLLRLVMAMLFADNQTPFRHSAQAEIVFSSSSSSISLDARFRGHDISFIFGAGVATISKETLNFLVAHPSVFSQLAQKLRDSFAFLLDLRRAAKTDLPRNESNRNRKKA
jgi:hypothetical protein